MQKGKIVSWISLPSSINSIESDKSKKVESSEVFFSSKNYEKMNSTWALVYRILD